ncbi:MAG TPA: ECF-type sigma factor [Gemmataceae bacterium]|nr:ECF-type sigma factor [Gemmataceae bacterium]
MSQTSSFDDLMARLQAGDPDAAALVVGRFAGRLVALARSRLGGRLRPKVDPEDVVQSVCKSFFARHARGQLAADSWDALWGLLALLTLRKCGRWREHFHAGVRDVGREVSPPADGPGPAWEAMAREPTPDEAALLAESAERLLDGLEERERAIVALGLQGYTTAEIGEQVGCTRRTVQRVLRRVRERLEGQGSEGDA